MVLPITTINKLIEGLIIRIGLWYYYSLLVSGSQNSKDSSAILISLLSHTPKLISPF